jgi:cytochrome b561
MNILWKNTRNSWGVVSITIHWLMAVTVISLFMLGLWMTSLTYYSNWYKMAPFIHKSVGLLLFFVIVAKLIWRAKETTPDHLPSHTKNERIMAHFMRIALHTLIFGIVASGYLISTADGRPVSVFGWFEVPATITTIPKQEDLAGLIHLYLASAVIGMAALHALAAVKHHIIDKDNTLNRMLGRDETNNF